MVYFKNKLEVSCPQDEPRDIEFALVRNAAEDRPVLLNIGGVRFEVTWELLDKLPQSRYVIYFKGYCRLVGRSLIYAY